MNNTELSICIPTYNRASILDETLAHLAQVDNLLLEVIVSDNASSDNTEEIVKKYNDKFSRFIYHRQSSNLGSLNNIQSALSFASSPLSYFLSDDDRIVPVTLSKVKDIFQKDNQVVAVYANHCEFDPYTGKEYDVVKHIQTEQIFTSDMRGNIFEQFGALWGPVVRTDIAQRFVYYDDTTFGFWRVVEMLFKHGSIVVIPDLIYKHAQTIPRMEHQLVEQWYHDSNRSDYELYVAGLHLDYTDSEVTDHVIKLIHERTVPVYLTAFSFAAQQEQYILQRHYLLRARSYGQVSIDVMKAWEEKFILHCTLERIETILKGLPCVRKVLLESSDITDYLMRIKSSERFLGLPEMALYPLESLLHRSFDEREVIIVMDYASLEKKKVRNQGYEFSLADMVSTLRVTIGDLDIKRF